jgi:hypothetical protein
MREEAKTKGFARYMCMCILMGRESAFVSILFEYVSRCGCLMTNDARLQKAPRKNDKNWEQNAFEK